MRFYYDLRDSANNSVSIGNEIVLRLDAIPVNRLYDSGMNRSPIWERLFIGRVGFTVTKGLRVKILKVLYEGDNNDIKVGQVLPLRLSWLWYIKESKEGKALIDSVNKVVNLL